VIDSTTKEKLWDEPLVRVHELSVLSAALNQAGEDRLIAAAAPYSGAFLHAHHTDTGHGDNSSLHIAIALRLGVPVCLPHTSVCRVSVDSAGRHGLRCRKSTSRLSRQSQCRQ